MTFRPPPPKKWLKLFLQEKNSPLMGAIIACTGGGAVDGMNRVKSLLFR
jgi:hypothetical protein